MVESILKTNSAKIKQITLTSSCQLLHGLPISATLMCKMQLPGDLSQGKHLPSTVYRTPYFHLHISLSEFVMPLSCKASGC